MKKLHLNQVGEWIYNAVLSVPVQYKITGIVMLPVLILGISLNYWVTASLSDWLSYILTDRRVEAAMQAGGRSVVLVTVLAAAASIILAALLTFLLTRPLLALREMAQQVAGGNLNARAHVWSKDEIGDVAAAINTMTDHLVATQNDLARSNRHLNAINQVMLAGEKEGEIHDTLYAVLKSTISVMDLQTGWVYLRDPERDAYHLASWYNVPPDLETHLLQKKPTAHCTCQMALVAGTLPAEASIQSCEKLQSCQAFGSQNKHITIPIQAREQNFGVMNLLCPTAYILSDDDLNLLSDIGAQTSEIVANAWLRLKLAEKELSRQALLESLVEAQEEERRRLARELHDGSGQMLTGLLVRIKTLEKKADSPEVRDGLTTMLDMVAETIDQLRDLSHRLRPAALEEFGLPVALETLVDDISDDAGLTITYNFDLNGVTLPAGIEVTLYRIAQECLTNIIRHAQASNVTINLDQPGDLVCMRVEDDGIGFDPLQITAVSGQRHLGIISMYERAAIVGGKLDVFSAPGQGTAILVSVPILMSVTDAR
jgi:signal transduction histidine kinase